MWEMIAAALTEYGKQASSDAMMQAGKGLFDSMLKPTDSAIDPYKPEQPVVYGDDGNLKPPAPNPYANLLSAASQPAPQQAPAPALPQAPDMQSRMPMPTMQPGMPTPNLGMSQMDPRASLARQAYGRYF